MALATEPQTLPLDPDELPQPLAAWVAAASDEATYDTDGVPTSLSVPPDVDPTWAPRIARVRARLEGRLRAQEAAYKAEADALALWHLERTTRIRAEIGRVDALLLTVLAQARDADPRLKTLKLPHGVTVATRATPARFTREEGASAEAALIAALGDGSEFIERRPKLLWGPLAKALRWVNDRAVIEATGEVLPESAGVTYRPAGVSESVKVE